MLYRKIKPKDVQQLISLRTKVEENALSMAELIEMGITEDSVINKIQIDK